MGTQWRSREADESPRHGPSGLRGRWRRGQGSGASGFAAYESQGWGPSDIPIEGLIDAVTGTVRECREASSGIVRLMEGVLEQS